FAATSACDSSSPWPSLLARGAALGQAFDDFVKQLIEIAQFPRADLALHGGVDFLRLRGGRAEHGAAFGRDRDDDAALVLAAALARDQAGTGELRQHAREA